MKTISFKVDNEFGNLLASLTSRLHLNKSEVIRQAVKSYSEQLDKDLLRKKIKSASLKTRQQVTQSFQDFENANNDGL